MVRLFQRAVMTGFRRNQANQYNDQPILHINEVNSAKEARWYEGKRVAYVYRALKRRKCFRSRQVPSRRSHIRVIWGRVVKPHGGSGAVRARFNPNLPSQAIGKKCRVYMFPSRI
mmetsp:Transcript_1756/g.2396  ORF Transcript_1756/g.2396 Transcript_1756/m.2396 type:complete len:115 (+) Transcript_1756:50-394(+)